MFSELAASRARPLQITLTYGTPLDPALHVRIDARAVAGFHLASDPGQRVAPKIQQRSAGADDRTPPSTGARTGSAPRLEIRVDRGRVDIRLTPDCVATIVLEPAVPEPSIAGEPADSEPPDPVTAEPVTAGPAPEVATFASSEAPAASSELPARGVQESPAFGPPAQSAIETAPDVPSAREDDGSGRDFDGTAHHAAPIDALASETLHAKPGRPSLFAPLDPARIDRCLAVLANAHPANPAGQLEVLRGFFPTAAVDAPRDVDTSVTAAREAFGAFLDRLALKVRLPFTTLAPGDCDDPAARAALDAVLAAAAANRPRTGAQPGGAGSMRATGERERGAGQTTRGPLDIALELSAAALGEPIGQAYGACARIIIGNLTAGPPAQRLAGRLAESCARLRAMLDDARAAVGASDVGSLTSPAEHHALL